MSVLVCGDFVSDFLSSWRIEGIGVNQGTFHSSSFNSYLWVICRIYHQYKRIDEGYTILVKKKRS